MLAELAAQLVSVDSVNPGFVAGGAGEAAVAQIVAGTLERAGLEVHVEEVGARPAERRRRGAAEPGGGRTLLLNAHTDTVGLLEPDGSTSPRREDGRLYGRGAYDMKASLAAIVLAGAECVERRLRGDVIVAAVVDEEVESIGTQALTARVARRRGDRRRADRRAGLRRAQGLRRLRGGDARTCGARLAA